MTSALIEQTSLWKRTLGANRDDGLNPARERLRAAFWTMRADVDRLLTEIPADCRELTVHDSSHLDALWEIADIIAGPDFDIGITEAFVFGGAVLLHDAGLSFAAFPGGMAEVKATVEWQDAAERIRRLRRQEGADGNLSLDDDKRVVFEVLRALHARQAQALATQAWVLSHSGDRYFCYPTMS